MRASLLSLKLASAVKRPRYAQSSCPLVVFRLRRTLRNRDRWTRTSLNSRVASVGMKPRERQRQRTRALTTLASLTVALTVCHPLSAYLMRRTSSVKLRTIASITAWPRRVTRLWTSALGTSLVALLSPLIRRTYSKMRRPRKAPLTSTRRAALR